MRKVDFDGDIYSRGPDWFIEAVSALRKKRNKDAIELHKKYALKDPRNGKVWIVDGTVASLPGKEEVFMRELHAMYSKYNKEISKLKDVVIQEWYSNEPIYIPINGEKDE